MVTKEMEVLHGTLMSLGKGNGCPGGEGVTRGVLVFGQGQDRIINAQLRVKLKLPARRSPTLLEVLRAAEELPHLQVPPSLAPTIHSILLTELMRPCPGDLLGKAVRGREVYYGSPQTPFPWLTQRTWGNPQTQDLPALFCSKRVFPSPPPRPWHRNLSISVHGVDQENGHINSPLLNSSHQGSKP